MGTWYLLILKRIRRGPSHPLGVGNLVVDELETTKRRKGEKDVKEKETINVIFISMKTKSMQDQIPKEIM